MPQQRVEEDDGTLKTIQKLKYDKTLKKLMHIKKGSKKYVYIPKWVIGISTIGFGFIFTVLISAISIVSVAPRQGLYGESCSSRSCLSYSNMKCINNKCQCPSNYYYAIKCLPKRDYNQTCSRTTPCKENTILYCKNGRCLCNDTYFWNGEYCSFKGTYSQRCFSNDECLTKSILYCEEKSRSCTCDSTRYWDGTSCNRKRQYNETCTSTTDCIVSLNAQCLFGKCGCSNSTHYWSTTYSSCLSLIAQNGSCTSNIECLSRNCTANKCR